MGRAAADPGSSRVAPHVVAARKKDRSLLVPNPLQGRRPEKLSAGFLAIGDKVTARSGSPYRTDRTVTKATQPDANSTWVYEGVVRANYLLPLRVILISEDGVEKKESKCANASPEVGSPVKGIRGGGHGKDSEQGGDSGGRLDGLLHGRQLPGFKARRR